MKTRPIHSRAEGPGAAQLGFSPRWRFPIKMVLGRTRSLVWLARTRGCPAGGGLRILFYHRVSDDHDELAVKPNFFRRQMEQLASDGYRVVDIPDAVRILESGSLPPRTVALSFDDGYRDVVEHALPILADYGFRATVFVVTAVADGRASFDWYSRQPPVLGWDEIAMLDSGGTLNFEAHSLTHPNLLRLSEEAARREIAESRTELQERLGRAITVFSYPSGLFSARERRLTIEAGFTAAVSCEVGANVATTDRFALRRIQIDHRDRMIDFRAKLGGGYDSPLPLRNAYRRLRYGVSEARRSSDLDS